MRCSGYTLIKHFNGTRRVKIGLLYRGRNYMKYKKLTTKNFISILSDDVLEQAELSIKPIEPYKIEDIRESTLGKKTIYKLTPAKAQYLEKLNLKFFNNIETNNAAIAYNGKSYLDMFEPHRKNSNFLRLDIKSFFHSINRDTLKNSLSAYVNDEYFFKEGKVKQSLLDALLNLISLRVTKDYKDKTLHEKDVLPIGFKSSPAISNIVFRKFDIMLQELCSRNDISYTRYADDMFFSSPITNHFLHTDKFLLEVSYILSLGGFSINKSKTIKDKKMTSINGYVIDSTIEGVQGYIRISEKKTKKIYKLIFMAEKNIPPSTILNRIFKIKNSDIKYKYSKEKDKFKDQFYHSQVLNRITGYRAYLISLIKYNNKYSCIKDEHISEYQELIKKLEKIIYKMARR